MSNLNLSVDLLALKGAFFQNFTGKDGVAHTCICIPCDIAHLQCWQDRNDEAKKKIFLQLTAWESKEKKFDNTHFVKQSFPKDIDEAMSDDEKKNLPIIGNGKEFTLTPKTQQGFNTQDPRVASLAQGIGGASVTTQPIANGDSELPF